MITAMQRRKFQADHSRVSKKVDDNARSNIYLGIAVEEHKANVFGNVSLVIKSTLNRASLDYNKNFRSAHLRNRWQALKSGPIESKIRSHMDKKIINNVI